MSTRGEVLVAIMNNLRDFTIAHGKHWYRIPVSSVKKWLNKDWPPQWLAFYQTKAFGKEAFLVRYYAKVIEIRQAYRWQLFPNEPQNAKSDRQYYQLFLGPLQYLSQPIVSRRWRRIIFIPTTWGKFINAIEINDLYNESPLEERLWAEFKRLQIQTERQELVTVKNQNYFLDFAIYCASGKIDVETDGDSWHANSEKATQDNIRDNHLKTIGWRILRFNTQQVCEQMVNYCIPTVTENINKLGGVDEARNRLPRKIELYPSDGSQQLGLFDN